MGNCSPLAPNKRIVKSEELSIKQINNQTTYEED